MAKIGKKYRSVQEKLAPGSEFDLPEATVFLKENSTTAFDQTAEVAFRLGVDPKKSDQMVRGRSLCRMVRARMCA